jgi:hypothetical protein
MNRLALGCIGLMVAPVLLYGSWVSYPPSRYESMSVQILGEAAARHTQEQQAAARPASNAYLDPDFLPLWGRKGVEQHDPSPAGSQLQVLNPLSDLAQGKNVNLEGRFREPAIRKKFQQFALFYPKLHKVCNQPDMLVPLTEAQNMLTVSPEWISLRGIAMKLGAYAEYLKLDGKEDEALGVAVDSLRLARLVSHQQLTWLRAMVGLASQSIAQEILAMILDNSRPRASLEPLLRSLEETQTPVSAFADCLEAEYCQQINSIPKLKQQTAGQSSFSPLTLLPGLEWSELRMFKNDYMETLQQVRQGQPINSSWASSLDATSWLLGRHSFLAAIAIPNYSRAGQNFQLVRTRQAFLHAFVGLLRARQLTGRFPTDLAQLQASGYKPLDGLELKRLVYTLKDGRVRLELNLKPQELPYAGGWEVEPGMEKWNLVVGPKWVLQAGD